MKMIRGSLLVFVCFLCNVLYSQQVIINDTFTPQQLVEDNLVLGCVETSNATSQINGSVNGFSSFGYFQKGSSNFPFENGIILSTGKAVSAGNGLNTSVLNEGQSNWATDPDLESALGINNTLNATSLEFDFVSISNLVQFNYLLASEEYFGDFPCNYSDGFAFLIKEAGTNDPYINIAVIPGTAVAVNTNSIHPEIVGFCPASYAQYFDGFNFPDTNFNGRTTILSAIANIIPNVTYHIKLIIADQTDKNYDSAVFIEGNSFNATVDLGDDISTCASSITLNGNIENPEAVYSWYFNSNIISGASQPVLTVNQSGNYTVMVSMPLAGSTCTIEDTIDISLNQNQTASPIADYEVCDDSSMDGIETFDLSNRTEDILASVLPSNYNISYHFSAANAENNSNPIINPIQNSSNNQVIFVRIEDIDNGCMAFANFQLVVNPLPNITSPTVLIACDDVSADGIVQIDLTQKNEEITNGQTNLIVSYHNTQADANSGLNAIPQPYVNIALTEELFVRVINSQTGCVNTTTLTINVFDSPAINNQDLYIDACDQDHNGMAVFDLTSIIDDVLQGITGVSVTFHETTEDAQLGTNPINDPTAYANTSPEEQIIYIRVENDVTGCASFTSVEIHSNLLLTGTNIQDFSSCDTNGDNLEEFNLNILATIIINNLLDVSVIFYASESDRDNQINALNTDIPLVPSAYPFILYITLNSSTCSEIAEIELSLSVITLIPSIGSVNYCDDDADGFTSIDLHSFDSQVVGGLSGFNVIYYASQEDADNNNNPLPAFYTNITNPQTFYPKLTSSGSGCGEANPFTITVLPAPIISQPNDIRVCDNDQDGFSVIDLTQVYSQLVTDTSNMAFSFFNTEADLINGVNPFTNINNFNTNSRNVHVKVTNTLTGCWSNEAFSIYVNTLPTFSSINNYKICELSSDGIGNFIFSSKDSQILNGQLGKKTSYYLNQQDADNRVNEINKNIAYNNVTNPQIIFVRVENLTDHDCYGTSSFNIEVGTSPLFNPASNWFKCDDLSNNASEVFDLSTKISEITQGINDTLDVTFYTSQANAQNGNNPIPLQFANTVNPQQIYARIDNGTICVSVTSFTLNVIGVAQANPTQPIEVCDTNYDGSVIFDLTLSELDILDVRQNNIIVSYYATMADLDAQNNMILDPTSYSNISNPQTVFVRLTNTISNCYLALPLELIVNLPPTINSFTNVNICNNATNSYDLTEVNSLLVNNSSNLIFNYYASNSDAQAAINPLDTNYTYSSNNTLLYARVENALTGCFATKSFRLLVNPLPIASLPNNLESCDDDYDGLLEFDLTAQNASIIGNQNPNNFSITYHNSLQQAQSASNALSSFYIATNGEIIYARVENNITGCYSLTQFGVIILEKPFVEISDQVICLDNLPLLVSANTNNATDIYLWSTNETTPEIEITVIGTYWVTVTSELGCETTEVFNVTESETASIDIVETVDFSDPNNITISISGIGNYLYQLDDEEPQDSNLFENVGIGYHTVTIIDLNGCAEITKEVLVLDFPQFMTPNDDGYFDTWHIIGVETLPGTIIYIYDRYGKQIHYLTSSSRGWDGTYNGHNMPATDYWFVADVKGGSYDFQAKGHFALRR